MRNAKFAIVFLLFALLMGCIFNPNYEMSLQIKSKFKGEVSNIVVTYFDQQVQLGRINKDNSISHKIKLKDYRGETSVNIEYEIDETKYNHIVEGYVEGNSGLYSKNYDLVIKKNGKMVER